jgi:hypothetical protein
MGRVHAWAGDGQDGVGDVITDGEPGRVGQPSAGPGEPVEEIVGAATGISAEQDPAEQDPAEQDPAEREARRPAGDQLPPVRLTFGVVPSHRSCQVHPAGFQPANHGDQS